MNYGFSDGGLGAPIKSVAAPAITPAPETKTVWVSGPDTGFRNINIGVPSPSSVITPAPETADNQLYSSYLQPTTITAAMQTPSQVVDTGGVLVASPVLNISPSGDVTTGSPVPVSAPIVVSDSSMPKDISNPPAVLVGTPQSAVAATAPQSAGLLDNSSVKALLWIAIPLIVIGFLTSDKNTSKVRR